MSLKEKQHGREDEEEEVNGYLMTLGQRESKGI
jgi:hypothetical protein